MCNNIRLLILKLIIIFLFLSSPMIVSEHFQILDFFFHFRAPVLIRTLTHSLQSRSLSPHLSLPKSWSFQTHSLYLGSIQLLWSCKSSFCTKQPTLTLQEEHPTWQAVWTPHTALAPASAVKYKSYFSSYIFEVVLRRWLKLGLGSW